MILKEKNNKGFTLVETLVAISILSLSILASFTAVSASLSQSYFAKDQVTAFYLVQEAVEYIRNVRDNNGLSNIASIAAGGSGVNWLSGISAVGTDPCWFGNYCYIDSPSNSIRACPNPGNFASCPYLEQNQSTGLFGYAGGTVTKFKRAVQLQQVNANEIIVTVRIDWVSGIFSKSIQVQQSLFNIR
jgi:prepilin-type N-terminal cleavage/methylation domain-containing protein